VIARKIIECDEALAETKKGTKESKQPKNDRARRALEMAEQEEKNNDYETALKQYRKALQLAKDNDPEAECLANFAIGCLLFKKEDELEKARAHLVEFQVYCQMKLDKSSSEQHKFKEASHLINQIQAKFTAKREMRKPKPWQKPAEPDKKPVKQSIKQILKDLEVKSKFGAYELLKYLKQTFKDITSRFDIEVFNKGSTSKVRKVILKFIQVFHPDKQHQPNPEETPEKTSSRMLTHREMLIVAEEVTKQLNLELSKY